MTETVTVTPSPTEPTALPPETETAAAERPAPPAVDLSQPPTSYDEAVAHVATSGEGQELGTFQSDDE